MKYFFYSEKFEHDLQLAYDVNDKFRLYGGVNNFTNEKGDAGSTAYPYSAVGRYFYAGAKVRFGGQ
nr:TonB-dependent receptor [Sphingomonas soli]